MKVKVKDKYIGSEEFYGWLKSDVNLQSELIVLGVDCRFVSFDKETNSSIYDIKYIFAPKYSFRVWVDSKFFYVVDGNIPNNWIIVQRDNDISMSYKCDDGQFAMNIFSLSSNEGYTIQLLNKYQKEEETKYYNLEIDNFFANENLKLSEEEKKSMIEYYKSQLNFEQWEKDKEFLSY